MKKEREYGYIPNFENLKFLHCKGGVDVKLRKFTPFETVPRELSVRLAHNGLFPIYSSRGYFYFLDYEDKIIGTSNINEMGERLLCEQITPNELLDKYTFADIRRLNF